MEMENQEPSLAKAAPSTQLAAAQKPKKQWFRALVLVLSTLLAILLIAISALWWWAGSDGSLATAIRLTQNCCVPATQQLTIENASGSLRHGGHIGKLVWQQGELKVSVNYVDLAWQPWALLHGTLKLDQISAASIDIDDQRPPTPPSAGPPESLRLPILVQLDKLSVGVLRFSKPSASKTIEVSGLAGRYGFNGLRHQLDLLNAQVAGGRYSGRAQMSGGIPLTLDASLSGAVDITMPNTTIILPLTFQAVAQGPLTQLGIKASLQTSATTATTPSSTTQPHASLTATVTPWAVQPVAQADATFKQLNAAALWPGAPQTLLTGKASVQPLTATSSTSSTATTTTTASNQAWALQLQVANSLPGPWDQHRLPLDKLDATGEWRNGAAIVRTLKALMGGGELIASGEWAEPATSSTAATGTASATIKPQAWKLQARLDNINPARLHTRLAALPVNGQASVASQGEAIGFDAKVQAAGASNTTVTQPVPKAAPGKKAAPAQNNPLAQLHLQSASATGSWNPKLSGGTLALPALRIRTDDAELTGQLEAQLSPQGGKGNLTLTAPGLDALVKGELRPNTGDGDLNLRIKDVAQSLGWLKKLPGLPDAMQARLRTAAANGNAELSAHWQGGWQDPALQARLLMPALDLRMAAAEKTNSAAKAGTVTTSVPGAATASQTLASALPNSTATTGALKFREVQANLSGRLSQAQLSAQGRVEAGERRLRLQLAADGGRAGPAATLAQSTWQGVVKQLDASVQDPALGTGTWGLNLRRPLSLKWTPTAPAPFESCAGEAVLNAPTASPSSATIAWQPVRWRGGELTSAGKVTGLPMAWVELLAGPQLAGVGLSGNLVFDGEWDARLAETINVKASLARSSGDITLQTETAEGTNARVAAGVHQASLSVSNEGDALTVALRWDSERAGTAEGQLKTRLSRLPLNAEGAGNWTWAADAPLNGQLRAQLPRIGVWSVLAPPGWRIRGSLGTHIAISGTRANPQLAGELQANDLALRSVVDGIEFGNGRLRAMLDGTRMRINEFTLQGAGQTGPAGKNSGTGGSLTAQGEAAWLDGQPNVQLDARLDRLRASIRTDRQLTVSGTLQARLDGKVTQFTGALKVDQARILLPEEGTPQLGEDVVVRSSSGGAGSSGKKGPAEANAPKAAPPKDGRSVNVAIQLDMGRDFRVQGKGIDTQLRGTLVLGADSLTEPRLSGAINTFGGQYRAYGQRLDVEQGVLRFTGPIDNPTLDILAIRPNLTQRVGVQITGTALLPRVRLYAQPELPDAEKLSWLVLGRSSASGGGEAALLQQAALALLGSKSGSSSGGLAGALGLDELSYRGASSNANGTTSEGAVTLGKRFSRNFYAAYERSISGALGTLFIFYDLSQRFTVRAQAGQQSAVDLIFTVPYD
jgi:translocation and assembly module TamB